MDHPIHWGVEILLVATCYRNRDKLQPGGSLGSYADFTSAPREQLAYIRRHRDVVPVASTDLTSEDKDT